MIRRARALDWEGARALWREVDDLHASLAPAYFRKTARAEPEWRALLAAADAAVFVVQASAVQASAVQASAVQASAVEASAVHAGAAQAGAVQAGAAQAGAPAAGATLAGVAAVRIYETPPDPAMVPLRRGHVELLVVSGAYRRRGVGSKLMAEVAAWARRQGAAELVLTVWSGNRAAEAFYERLGYRELSRVLNAKLG